MKYIEVRGHTPAQKEYFAGTIHNKIFRAEKDAMKHIMRKTGEFTNRPAIFLNKEIISKLLRHGVWLLRFRVVQCSIESQQLMEVYVRYLEVNFDYFLEEAIRLKESYHDEQGRSYDSELQYGLHIDLMTEKKAVRFMRRRYGR